MSKGIAALRDLLAPISGQKTVAKGVNTHLDEDDDDMLEEDELMVKGEGYEEDDDEDETMFSKTHQVDGAAVLQSVLAALEKVTRKQDVQDKKLNTIAKAVLDTHNAVQGQKSTIAKAVNAVSNAPRVARSGRKRPAPNRSQRQVNPQVLAKAVDVATSDKTLFSATDVSILSSMAQRGDVDGIKRKFNTEQRAKLGLLNN